jgi:hypothetical protein
MKLTRFADYDDLYLILDFLKQNPADLGKEIIFSSEEKETHLKKILQSNSQDNSYFFHKIVIQIENSKINGLIYMMMFKFINQYFLYGLKVKTTNNYYKLKATVIEDLYNYALSYSESLGYYSYYAIATESSDSRKTEIAYKELEKLQRYEKYIIGYIPSDQLPCFDIIKIIKPKKTKQKVLVRNFLLKQEYRCIPDLSTSINFDI